MSAAEGALVVRETTLGPKKIIPYTQGRERSELGRESDGGCRREATHRVLKRFLPSLGTCCPSPLSYSGEPGPERGSVNGRGGARINHSEQWSEDKEGESGSEQIK